MNLNPQRRIDDASNLDTMLPSGHSVADAIAERFGRIRPARELIDWDEPDDDQDGFTVDDVSVGPPAYVCDQGAYYVETGSRPHGWISGPC